MELSQPDMPFGMGRTHAALRSPLNQQAVLKALEFKCDTLSAMLCFIMPMWRRSMFRPAPSCRRTGAQPERSERRHRLRSAATAAARRAARP